MSRSINCVRLIRSVTRNLSNQPHKITYTPFCQSLSTLRQSQHLVSARCFSQTTSVPASHPASQSPSSSPVIETEPVTTLPVEEKPKVPLKRRIRTFFSTNRQYVINAAIILSAAGASYFVFDQCVELVSFMQSINHAEGLTYAFYAGSAVTLSTYAIFRGAFSFMPVKTAPAYRALLKRLRQESNVAEQLGAARTYHRVPASKGGFQCVTRRAGGPRFFKESSTVDYMGSWERWWRPRRVQFMMSFRGEKADAVLIAQIDHKLNDTFLIRSMSLEHIQPRSESSADVLPRLTAIETKGAPWRQSVTTQ